MTWLIVGGAGYIGSHLTHYWRGVGTQVVVLDDLSTGRAESVPSDVPLVVGNACDPTSVAEVMVAHSITGVVHLAARKHARESVRLPLEYWRTNIAALLGVLQAADHCDISAFLLSSSCSVYGSAGEVSPDTPLRPQSPYGRTKALSETIVRDWARSKQRRWAALRYFNVIGNAAFAFAPDRSDECLVPVATQRVRSGLVPMIFGADFPTPDGTALRDYVDVRDLARAHVLVAEDLGRGTLSTANDSILNVSSGEPTSVRRIVEAIRSELDWQGDPDVTPRRAGDPDRVWAQPSNTLHELGWAPEFSVEQSVQAHVHHVDSKVHSSN